MTTEVRPNYSTFPDLSSVLRKETERQNVGVALLIVANDPTSDSHKGPLVWTVRELKDDEATEKKAGQISIIGERKRFEEPDIENIQGGIVEEFCGGFPVKPPIMSIVSNSRHRNAILLNSHSMADL